MNCPHCEAALPEGASFCQVCGRALVSQPPAPKERLGLPITALILGVGSFLLFPLTFLPALVLSIVGLVRASRRQPAEKTAIGMCIGGLVCALVAMPIWLAILIPVFATAREKAQQSQCLSNMKQLAFGIMIYVQDYDGVYPPAGQWATNLQPYVKTNQIFICPSKPELPCGYAYNSKLDRAKEMQVSFPSSIIMIFESDAGMDAAGGAELLAEPRHHGFGSFSYADGHCKMVLQEDWSNLEWELARPDP